MIFLSRFSRRLYDGNIVGWLYNTHFQVVLYLSATSYGQSLSQVMLLRCFSSVSLVATSAKRIEMEDI